MIALGEGSMLAIGTTGISVMLWMAIIVTCDSTVVSLLPLSRQSGLTLNPKRMPNTNLLRDCREFRVWVGHIGMKEIPDAPTQRACDT
jgi:hypothetical protein